VHETAPRRRAAKERAHLVNVETRKAGQVQPAIKKHGAVACTEDESIAVDPGAVVGVEGHGMAVEHGTKLGATERKSKVPAGAFVDGVHGKAAGLIGSAREIRHRKGLRHFSRSCACAGLFFGALLNRLTSRRCNWRTAVGMHATASPLPTPTPWSISRSRHACRRRWRRERRVKVAAACASAHGARHTTRRHPPAA
jgi:hypothetical protein